MNMQNKTRKRGKCMKMKKLLAAAGAAAMAMTSLPMTGITAFADDMEEIVFATPLSKTVDMSQIETELNKITEEKIGVHVKIEGISLANYKNQIGLMMSGGEKLDAFGYIGSYSEMLAKNQFLKLDEYLDEYGSGIKEALGEELLKACTNQGSVYAIPTNNGKAAAVSIVLRKDFIDELGLPVDQLKLAENFEEYCENLDLLTEMFAKIKEAHPDYTCLVPYVTNPNIIIYNYLPFSDSLDDGNGILMPGDDDTVVNMYATEEFKKMCEYTYEWNQAGYILEDATTTQETANTYMQNNRTAGYFIKGEEGQAEQITTATGVEVEAIKILKPYIKTTDVNSIGFAISPTSEHPEAAMKFLNEMYTNPDVVNLLDWGIEGVHYEKQEDGTIDYPEGVDANTTTYGLNMDWFFGNQFLSYIWGKGRDTTIYSRLEENNKNSDFSPVMGFAFDSTAVSTEVAALVNVTNQYLPGLTCGSLNPDTEMDTFLKALDDAGMQTVIEEKQKQLDAWKAENQQ